MNTAHLTPVSALDDALAKARDAARATLSLVAVTLHHQFPTGAYLVLTRPVNDYDDDVLELDSIRDVEGGIVHEFNLYGCGSQQLPPVPEDIAALWGSNDPREPHMILDLIQRIDAVTDEFFDFLPPKLRTPDEIQAEEDGGRTPLGVPLRPADCPVHGALCEPDDHIEPPTVRGEVI